MNILVTGAFGFIGSCFIRKYAKANPDYHFVILDNLTYAGDPKKIENCMELPNVNAHVGSIAEKSEVLLAMTRFPGQVDAIVNFAAESHVDNSIHTPDIFLKSNVLGTATLLDVARETQVSRFLQVSTDEVYGSAYLSTDHFKETDMLKPNSPYSASKASADLMVRAWHKTYGLDTLITRCTNNYGPYQHEEKLIPKAISILKRGGQVPIYGKGDNIREWIHVEDHCSGIWKVLHKGKSGEIYNIGAGPSFITNLDIMKEIMKHIPGTSMDKNIKFVEDRLGHDHCYSINANKIKQQLGWEPEHTFKKGIEETVKWYLENGK